ncbi:hypothetical protein GCM10023116_13470 [Kistimonas scapharcae]|uniref:Uncharacterized protein n=1 Tax=Kistimonas scapharcae TaxID=1036133 RepID=A0ABP8V0W6_9GAMM
MLAIALGDVVVVDIDNTRYEVKRQVLKLPKRLCKALMERDLAKLVGNKPLSEMTPYERQWAADAINGDVSFVTSVQVARIAERMSGEQFHGTTINHQLRTMGFKVQNAYEWYYKQYTGVNTPKQKGFVIAWQV